MAAAHPRAVLRKLYTRAHTHTHGGGLCNTRACIAYRGRAALPPFSPNHACIGATCANISRTSGGGGGYLCMRAFGETLRRARERVDSLRFYDVPFWEKRHAPTRARAAPNGLRIFIYAGTFARDYKRHNFPAFIPRQWWWFFFFFVSIIRLMILHFAFCSRGKSDFSSWFLYTADEIFIRYKCAKCSY